MELLKPSEIETRSFEIITSGMKKDRLEFYSEDELEVVKRAIHTTADFDFQDNIIFQNNALRTLKNCIQSNAMLFTDTNMALTGINKTLLDRFDIEPMCLISEAETVQIANSRNTTRAIVAIERAYDIWNDYNSVRRDEYQEPVPIIFAVGNAPTALIRISELFDSYRPDFIIAAPVGFVNVIEAKELIKQSGIPAIICNGNKGGSNVCAAIVNAVLKQLNKEF